MADKIKVIDCKQSDNEYLHKDFHGALCYAIKYLDDNFGEKATEDYLAQVGSTYFKPLAKELQKDGLQALEKHWRHIFEKEQGEFRIYYDGSALVLEVNKCPAIPLCLGNLVGFLKRYTLKIGFYDRRNLRFDLIEFQI